MATRCKVQRTECKISQKCYFCHGYACWTESASSAKRHGNWRSCTKTTKTVDKLVFRSKMYTTLECQCWNALQILSEDVRLLLCTRPVKAQSCCKKRANLKSAGLEDHLEQFRADSTAISFRERAGFFSACCLFLSFSSSSLKTNNNPTLAINIRCTSVQLEKRANAGHRRKTTCRVRGSAASAIILYQCVIHMSLDRFKLQGQGHEYEAIETRRRSSITAPSLRNRG